MFIFQDLQDILAILAPRLAIQSRQLAIQVLAQSAFLSHTNQ